MSADAIHYDDGKRIGTVGEMIAEIKKLRALKAEKFVLLEHCMKSSRAKSGEIRRLMELLEQHRRFHNKVGCPGKPDCYVCASED